MKLNGKTLSRDVGRETGEKEGESSVLRINVMLDCLHEPKNDFWMDYIHPVDCTLRTAKLDMGRSGFIVVFSEEY
jgi:hypothetical protein